jgi:integrase
MPAYKDQKTGNWYVFFYYRDWQGDNKGKTKRGFKTKRNALEWEREFKQKQSANLDMTFESFVKIYAEDRKSRLKYNTWLTKQHIIETKLIPHFGNRPMNAIKPTDIIKWQNSLIDYRNESGQPYSETYLKTVHNQINAIFNHAVRFYGLNENPAHKAGHMGKSRAKEMSFWTKEEYLKFSEKIKDKPKAFYAFEVLYWCGLREGELLALTPNDIDFDNKTLTVSKSYQRLERKDYITEPKTPKSNRTIYLPDFLCGELKEYIGMLYGIEPTDRMFLMTKHFLRHEMIRGTQAANVKRIRVHDLRHSHVSLLIEMGFSPVAIAERVGHESIDITLRYAHLFPSKQSEMANRLNLEKKRKSHDERSR